MILVHESLVVLIILFHWFGIAWQSWHHLQNIFSSKLYSDFISLQLLKTPDGLDKCSTKLIFSFEKSWKCNGLLLILISLLNHKNWDLRQLGLSGRKAKVFFHEWKMFMQNSGNKLRETLKSRLEWKIKHSPNVFLIKVKGIIFHSWKLSSFSFLIQEHCKLIIFELWFF